MTKDINNYKQFRFRKFQIYKDARVLGIELKNLSKKFPKEENFCLRSQLWRALDSIVLNIAEGSDRGTDKDFAHFLNTSRTSLNEVIACLDLAYDNRYLTENELNFYVNKCGNLANQLTAFRRKLLNEPTK
jgi:four helix bundle protein